MSFRPTQIIFAVTDECNLHCPHCFVNRAKKQLSIDKSVTFLKNCIQESQKNPNLPTIEKIGFTGGEPFLYLDFITTLSRTAVELKLMFDQIMTNGDWWKDETDLRQKLQTVYNSGYDGKIGLSYDSFHGQQKDRIETFISTVQEIFGSDSINIQTVIKEGEVSPSLQPASQSSATPSAGSDAARNACLDYSTITQYFLPQTYISTDPRAWKSKKWFKEDYCEGPGQIFYIHPDGNIAPCCGFANENPQLFIGTINDSLSQIMQNAEKNEIVKICYETGLGKYRKQLKKELRKSGKKYPGKCGDICSFCDFVCKNKK